MIELKSKSKTEKKVLDAGTTRTRLDALLTRAFDPDVIGEHRLHPVETARFIADQARKLRLAAMRSGHTGLVWMIESVYYEAYTMGCARQGLEVEGAAAKRN